MCIQLIFSTLILLHSHYNKLLSLWESQVITAQFRELKEAKQTKYEFTPETGTARVSGPFTLCF